MLTVEVMASVLTVEAAHKFCLCDNAVKVTEFFCQSCTIIVLFDVS